MAGDLRRCSNCGQLGWFNTTILPHRCLPEWECRGDWEDWGGADWDRVRAPHSEAAAEAFAENYDCNSGEYPIVSGRMLDCTVYVRKPIDIDSDQEGPHLAECFAVEGETVPTYRATKIGG